MTKIEKNATPFIMLSDADNSSALYVQVYEKIREEILSGRVLSSAKLPSTRTLAEQLGVSRITITNAYEQLFAEGYLEGKIGSGTFVASELPEEFLQTSNSKLTNTHQDKPQRIIHLSNYGEKLSSVSEKLSTNYSTSKCTPFQNGLPAIDKFPIHIWSKIAQKLQKNFSRELLNYGETAGFHGLREAVATHLKSARGVNCTPEQIIITSGTQQGLDIIGRILVNPGDSVWLENPCYLGARSTFDALGANLKFLPIDNEGLNFSEAKNEKEIPKLIYATPSHQFPLGITMSLQRRLNLLEWAQENDSWIIEDDYNSEYRFAGRPLASLQGLDRYNRVIYLGTFSKTIFPALRLGCMVVPEELVEICKRAKALLDRHSPIFDQLVLAEFISAGHYTRHIRRMRKLYSERREIMIDELKNQLGAKVKVQPSSAGLHLTIWLDKHLNDTEISRKLAAKGIVSEPLSSYVFKQKMSPGLVMGYAAFDEKQIRNGIGELAKILK